MVSFSCEVCNDTIIKKKLNQHFSKCPQAYFTCIDCNKTFYDDYNSHTSCITEAEKYEKSLYKPKRQSNEAANKSQTQQATLKPKITQQNALKQKSHRLEELELDKSDKKGIVDKKDKKSKKPKAKKENIDDFKITKPIKLKKFLKSLDKSQARIFKNLKVTKSDGSLILQF